jgi:hypothetical protein
MRDKTMSNPSQRRAGRPARAPGQLVRRSYTQPLAALALAIRLLLPASALGAREQNQLRAQAAPPDVQITRVKTLPVLNDKATTDVEIRWTAQVPSLTTIDEFDVLLEVHYSDGSRGAARNQQMKSTARATILALATHPRQNSTAVLKDFRASINVRFRITSSFSVVHQIAASQSDGGRHSSGSSSGSQPEVIVTAAKLVTQGCSAGYQCVDVKWTAAAPRNMTISEFKASVDALHKDGTQTTDSKTVGGQDRQARLQAGRVNVEVNSMKVSLLTCFSLLDSKTAVREGTFSIDSLRG